MGQLLNHGGQMLTLLFKNEVFDDWVLNNDLPMEPKRLFKAWIEDDWEWACIEEK
jgi:hypothetical protein